MMQLNTLLKTLMIILPIITITACSFNKDNDQNNQRSSINHTNSNLSSEKIAHQKLQELQNNNSIYFDFDKYVISSEYANILDKHALFLRNNQLVKVIIEGHTDERGTPEYNIALGERRANSVKIYLQSKGVSEDKLFIISYGKEKPSVLGHTEADYAKNRRVIIAY